MLWTAIGDIVPSALAIAMNPIGITVIIFILQADRARAKGALFVGAWALSVFAASALAYYLAEAVDVDTDETAARGVNLLQLLFGLALIGVAIQQWRSRPGPGDPPRHGSLFARLGKLSPLGAFGIGLATALSNVKTIPFAANAGARLAQAGVSGTSAAVGLVVFTALASLTVAGPFVAAIVFGERSRQPLDDIKNWLEANLTTILVIVFLLLGGTMAGKGLALFS